MYSRHFRDNSSHFVLGDIHKLSATEIPTVTLATASFPCTDLSLAGSRNGLSGRESSAFWGFTRILEDLAERKPPFVLLENVTGFLTSHQGNDFRIAMQKLNTLGYSVDAFILDAVRFVPQSRQRLFVVGVQNAPTSHAAISPITQAEIESDVRPKALANYIVQHQSDIRWCIRQFPIPPKQHVRLDTILEDVPHDSSIWWTATRASKLLNQMSAKHRCTAEGMIVRDSWSYGTVFRRMRVSKETGKKQSMAELRTDGIAGCLRTPKGGSAKQILFKAGFGQYHVRLLTPREAARLMGADDYILPNSHDSAYFGFGDAVCVPVVQWVAQNYLDTLVEENSDSTDVGPIQASLVFR